MDRGGFIYFHFHFCFLLCNVSTLPPFTCIPLFSLFSFPSYCKYRRGIHFFGHKRMSLCTGNNTLPTFLNENKMGDGLNDDIISLLKHLFTAFKQQEAILFLCSILFFYAWLLMKTLCHLPPNEKRKNLVFFSFFVDVAHATKKKKKEQWQTHVYVDGTMHVFYCVMYVLMDMHFAIYSNGTTASSLHFPFLLYELTHKRNKNGREQQQEKNLLTFIFPLVNIYAWTQMEGFMFSWQQNFISSLRMAKRRDKTFPFLFPFSSQHKK